MAHEGGLTERARLCRLLARSCSVPALSNALIGMAADCEARAATGAAASFRPPDYHRHAVAPPRLT